MKKFTVYHYDAFTDREGMGNPAGIVFGGDHLTDDEMQEIAHKVGFNETSFPVTSEIADVRIRFFTPGHEINLCGHATIATVYALKTRGYFGDKDEITIETNVGILPIKISSNECDKLFIKMKQAEPQFHSFNGSKAKLMESIGLSEEHLDIELPIVYGSTGTWSLFIPIKHVASFEHMIPQNLLFPEILTEMPRAALHLLSLETYDNSATMHGRHFSSPYSGTIEDPVTGTASGLMGVYYAKFIAKQKLDSYQLIVEQGQEIGKDGRVLVQIDQHADSYDVYITGNAVYVNEFEISIEN